LSRGDFALGDNLHFNETIFTTLANSNPGVDYYNATSASQVQDSRLAISLATNPNITNTGKEFDVRTRESGLYLSVMGNPLTGVAPKQYGNLPLIDSIETNARPIADLSRFSSGKSACPLLRAGSGRAPRSPQRRWTRFKTSFSMFQTGRLHRRARIWCWVQISPFDSLRRLRYSVVPSLKVIGSCCQRARPEMY
jgi:hypothetical protein